MKEIIEDSLWNLANSSANHAFGMVVGGGLGIAGGGLVGGFLGFKIGNNSDPCKDGQMLTTIGGALAGAYFGGWTGAGIGAVSGVSGPINLITTPFYSVFNSLSSAVGVVAENASNIASAAGNAALGFVSQHQVAIGVSTVAAAVGTLGYMAYNHFPKEQLKDYVSSLSKPTEAQKLHETLAQEDKILESNFRNLEKILGQAAAHDSELDKSNKKLLNEYFTNREIKLETILEIKAVYEKIIEKLPEKKLEEVKSASIALIESVGKCNGLRERILPKSKSNVDNLTQSKAKAKESRHRN